MGEDRRPNIAGRDVPEPDERAPEHRDETQLKLDAKSLRERTSADGHMPSDTSTQQQPPPR